MRRKKSLYAARAAAVLITAVMMAGGTPGAALADAAQQSGAVESGDYRLIEEGGYLYYEDENGERLKNSWISMENDDWERRVDEVWYYFGSTGSAFYGGKKEIEGNIYIFDDDGVMLSGWQEYDDDLYYLGDENDGRARIGWNVIAPDEEDGLMPEENRGKNYDIAEWFYFDSKGRAYRGDKKTIEKETYAFDKNGVMLNQWVSGERYAPDPFTAYYDRYTGARRRGWLYMTAPEDTPEFSSALAVNILPPAANVEAPEVVEETRALPPPAVYVEEARALPPPAVYVEESEAAEEARALPPPAVYVEESEAAEEQLPDNGSGTDTLKVRNDNLLEIPVDPGEHPEIRVDYGWPGEQPAAQPEEQPGEQPEARPEEQPADQTRFQPGIQGGSQFVKLVEILFNRDGQFDFTQGGAWQELFR